MLLPRPALAQSQGEIKIPKTGKIAGGRQQQAFTGKIQSVDVKLKLISVKPEESKGSVLFKVKKNVDIRTARGERVSLNKLNAGTDVVVYYEIKGTRRTVKKIMELSAGTKKEVKKSPPPSQEPKPH